MVSDLKHKFYRKLDGLRNTVFDNLISRGYFNTRPDRVRKVYLSVGISVAVLGGFAGIFPGDLLSLSPLKSIAAFVVTGGIIAAFSRIMPAKTVKGAKIYQACRGFEEFLTRAAKDRLERMADKKLFEKYLPYAIALDVSDRWAKAFEGIYQEPPGWYVTPRGYVTFDTVSFNRSLETSLSSMGQAMFTAPRSSGAGSGGFSGGGSSGGGFGGGGGGSW
ncbi:hypothetical protein BMS3Bbin06_00326 [bacterium BMS3Bbin06]|nr:hypothetical protein BMS3Abin08_00955 [bacterium BMS3Abin08]GBE33811.1 hypothetical protein BMS3Bbin06_00326 [bacterium BMS3Bbin06]